MVKTKAQLKIQEMAFMLMGVVLLAVIALLFFITIKYKNLGNTAETLEKEKIISGISKLADSAEFSCGKPGCVDMDKLLALKQRKEYADFWGFSSLKLVLLGGNNTFVECTDSNYPECNLFTIIKGNSSEETLSTFASLCRKDRINEYTYDKCSIGKIIAGMES